MCYIDYSELFSVVFIDFTIIVIFNYWFFEAKEDEVGV